MTTSSDPADDDSPLITEALKLCVAALIDLNVEQKMILLDKLGQLIEAELASFDPASAPGKTH
jgi:hypothetical protein